MPSCQAFNCTNDKGKCAKSFFVIPDTEKSAEKRKLCKLWISNLKNGKLQFETFKYNSSKVVCEDHFTPDSFERNLVKESLNFAPKRKQLHADAVPTIVNTGMSVRKRQPRSESATKKHQQAKVKEELMSSIKKTKKNPAQTAVSTDTFEHSLQPHTSIEEIPRIVRPQAVINPDITIRTEFPPIILDPLVSASQVNTDLPFAVSQVDDSVGLLKSCGHPCMMCLQANSSSSSILITDHSYTKTQGTVKSTRTIGVNTDQTMQDLDQCN